MQRLSVVVLLIGSLAGSSPAAAVLVDDFSVGSFSVQSTGPSGAQHGQDGQFCYSFCFGGNRGVTLSSTVSGQVGTAQLLAPPGVAQIVFPTGGGSINFRYRSIAPSGKNITEGGTATRVHFLFTAFEPGGSVHVVFTDRNNVAESHHIFPVFATPPTQQVPGLTWIPLALFVSVDLKHITDIRIVINPNPGPGVYALKRVDIPGSAAVTKTTFGEGDTDGPPYPTFPKIGWQWETIPFLGPVIDIAIGLDDVQDESGIQVGAIVQAIPDGTVSFLETTLESPATSPTLEYRFDFFLNETGSAIATESLAVSWAAGQDFAEVTARLPVSGGTWSWRLFIETNQPVNLANVTAVEGSALVSVEISGDVDTGSPVLKMATAADFEPTTAAVPSFDRAWKQAVLVLAILAGTLGVVRIRARASR